MHFCLLGAGRVGRTLAAALVSQGHTLMSIWSRRGAPDSLLPDELRNVRRASDPFDATTGCDAVLVAVSDDALADVAEQVAAGSRRRHARSIAWNRMVVTHFSGRHGTTVLEPLTLLGAHPLAAHPAFPFTDDVAANRRGIAGTRFALTGDPVAVRVAGAVIRSIGGIPFVIDEVDRALYHAVLTFASTGLVTLSARVQEVLGSLGVQDQSEVLRALLVAALQNSLRQGPLAATGPIVRADQRTIADHVAVLAERAPHLLPSYRSIGVLAAEMAREQGQLTDDQVTTLARILHRDG